jgi:hypothetical protein
VAAFVEVYNQGATLEYMETGQLKDVEQYQVMQTSA